MSENVYYISVGVTTSHRRIQNPVKHLKVERFTKIVNGFQLTVFVKGSMFDRSLYQCHISRKCHHVFFLQISIAFPSLDASMTAIYKVPQKPKLMLKKK